MHLRRPAANFILLCINNLVIVLLIIDGPCQLPVLESWLHTITGSHIILLLSAKQHVEPNQDARVQPTSRKISLTRKNITGIQETTYKFMEDVTLTITYQAFHLPAMIKRNTQSEWRTKVRFLLQWEVHLLWQIKTVVNGLWGGVVRFPRPTPRRLLLKSDREPV